MNTKQILQLEFFSTDLDKTITIKDYMKELLITLFREKDGFSGKRPFGNSGLEWDLAKCFVDNKIISGTKEDLGDGDIDYDFDMDEFDKAILEIFKQEPTEEINIPVTRSGLDTVRTAINNFKNSVEFHKDTSDDYKKGFTDALREQPTAYDVDAVISKLLVNERLSFDMCDREAEKAFRTARDIVKGAWKT